MVYPKSVFKFHAFGHLIRLGAGVGVKGKADYAVFSSPFLRYDQISNELMMFCQRMKQPGPTELNGLRNAVETQIAKAVFFCPRLCPASTVLPK